MATTLAPRPAREKRRQPEPDAPLANDSGASAGMPLFMNDAAPAEREEQPLVAVAAETVVPADDTSDAEALATPYEPDTAEAELDEQDLAEELPTPDEAPPTGEGDGAGGEGKEKKKGKGKSGDGKPDDTVPSEGAAAAEEVASVLATDDTAAAAITRADASVAMIGELGAGVSALASERVTFAPARDELAAGGDVEGARAHRAVAESMASGFVAHNAGQIQTVLAFAQVVPERIAVAAANAKGAIDATIASACAAVMERCASARMQAYAAAAAAKGRILGEYAATVAAVNSATLQSRTTIDATHQAALALVTVQELAQFARISTLYATKDPVFRAAGTTVGDEAVAQGSKRRWEWLDQRNYESDILDGPYHDDKLEARADAAVKVADAYKNGLIEQANKEADAAQLGKPKDLATVGETATQSRLAIDTMHEQAIGGLEAAEAQVLAGAESAKESMLASVRSTLADTVSGFAVDEATQIATLTEFGESQKIAVDRDAAAAVVGLVDGVSDAAVTLTDALAQFSGATRGAPPPDENALALQLALAQADFDQMAAGVLGKLDEGLLLSEAGIADSGAQSVTAANTMMQAGIDQVSASVEAFATSASGIAQGAASAYADMRQSHAAGAAETTAGAMTGFFDINARVAEAFNETAQNLDKNFEDAAKNLTKGLRDYVSEKLDADINKHADEAEAQVQPRWKSVLKVLLVIAVILVVALVAGPAVIGAIGAAAGALGASAATAAVVGTVVGGAIVGAASGAVIQIGNNVIDQIGGEWSLGKTFDGVGKAMVVGAIGGALGGIGSVLGKGASAMFSSGFGKFVVDTGVNMVGDVAGGVLGDLVVGNPITLQGVLVGAGIGLGVGIAGSNLGKLGKIGKGMEGLQGRSMKVGEGFGESVGAGLGKKIGITPKVSVEVAPKVDVAETKAPKVEEPTAPKVEEPSTAPKVEEPVAPKKIEEPSAAPKAEEPAPKVDEPGTAPKVEEPTESPRSSHEDHPEIEEGVVAKEVTADGHEIKVLKDGRTAVCSDCATIRNKYSEELDANPKLKKALDKAEAMTDPKAKAKAAKAVEAELKLKRAEAKAEAHEELVADAKKLIGKSRKFTDPALELRYQEYRARKIGRGEHPRGRAEWKVRSDYWRTESPTVRGNDFNATVKDRGLYPFDEVHLANGKRVDGYDPDANGGKGEIISRKAVDFDAIDESTFKSYLKEMKTKYSPGEKINSPKYADDPSLGTHLKGDLVLEVPAQNKDLKQLAATFEALAKAEGITIRYTPE